MVLPIEEDTDKTMRAMGIAIDDFINKDLTEKKYGYVLIVFQFGDNDEKVGHYISNADRKDMIKALREKADILENKMDIPVVDKQSH